MTLDDWKLQTFVYPDWTMKRWVLQLNLGTVILETCQKRGYDLKFGYGSNPIAVMRARNDEDAFRIARKHIINELLRKRSGITNDLKKMEE